MNPPLPERLARALLAEMVSGNYRAGRRFLSHRKIMKQWKISTPTASKALARLKEWQVVEARDRSGHYLTENFREQALLKLNDLEDSKVEALPAQPSWETRVAMYKIA